MGGRGLCMIVIGLLQLMAACGSGAESERERSGAGAGRARPGTGSGSAGGASAAGRDDAESACAVPVAVAMTPRSIADVVAMLNGMPKPVTLACFIESLAPPLALYATQSVLSAQPANGKRSPRTFLFMDPLIMSVVPDGVGSALLELGERRSETHSLKAELEFPITSQLTPASPFTSLRYDDKLSTCEFCHAASSPAPDLDLPYALISQAIRPLPRERVAIEQIRIEANACDPAGEPERCAILRALFGAEPQPSEVEFPPTYRTFL